MRPISLALVTFLSLIAAAAPVPKETEAEKIKRLFGTIVDPDRDCRVSLEGNVLRLRVSDRPHGIMPTKGILNAPRVLREVEGDFTAVAAISILKPASSNPAPTRLVAGMVILAGDNTVLYHARQFDSTQSPPRLGGVHGLVLTGRQVRSGGSGGGIFAEETATFRIVRSKDKLRLAVASEEGKWHIMPEFAAPLPDRVSVGVYAGHEGNSAFTAEFEDLVISRDAPGGGKP